MMMTIACHSDVMNSPIARPDDGRLIRHQDRRDAERQVGGDLVHGPLHVVAECQDVAAVAHGDGEADRRLAIHPEHGLRGIDVGPPDVGDIAQPKQAAVGSDVDARISSSDSNAPETRSASLSSPVCRMPAGLTAFCACSAAIRSARSMPNPASFLVENSMVIFSSCAPRIRPWTRPQCGASVPDLLDVIPKLAVCETVRGEPIDDPISIAELIVEAWTDNAGRSVWRMSPTLLRT